MTRAQDEAAAIVSDPERFSAWWQNRIPNAVSDRAVVKAAAAAELVHVSGGMLTLTSAGREFRP